MYHVPTQPTPHQQGGLLLRAVLCATILQCGAAPSGIAPVIHGVLAAAADSPATGALFVMDGATPRLACTGTLIAPDVVLTAAHCMVTLGRRLPSFTLANSIHENVPGEAHRAADVIVHPRFDVQAAEGSAMHDLAMVLLAEPIRAVGPETLISAAEARALRKGAWVELVGYGARSAKSDERGRKNRGRAKLAGTRAAEWVIGIRAETQNCNGDSGGPAFVVLGGRRRLMGIVSRAVDAEAPCTSGTLHSRLDVEAPWITATMARSIFRSLSLHETGMGAVPGLDPTRTWRMTCPARDPSSLPSCVAAPSPGAASRRKGRPSPNRHQPFSAT